MTIIEHPDRFLNRKVMPFTEAELAALSPDDLLPQFQAMIGPMQVKHGVGIAAPQVGIHMPLIIVAEDEMTIRFLINPRIVQRSGVKVWSQEGCLSVPKAGRRRVRRDVSITVEAINAINLQPITIGVKEKLAFRYQHEIDHLNGRLLGGAIV